MSRPGGGNTSVRRSNSAPICRGARRTVAVDATTFGRDRFPCASSQVASRSTADSYSPTSEPSGPAIRCSSSWMIRSGGRSGPTFSIRPAGSPPLAGCAEVSLFSSHFSAMVSAVTYPCRVHRRFTRPNRFCVSPRQVSCANLSTVAMIRLGSSR